FAKTNRKMMDEMANHATRVRRHIDRQGQEVVERFIDACLSVEYLIDPHSAFIARPDAEDEGDFEPERYSAKSYMDPFINPQRELTRQREEHEKAKRLRKGRLPARPTRDVLLFMLRH